MFVVFLKFSNSRSKAGELMAAHNEWIQSGFDDGVFLVVGTLQPGLGGTVVAHHATRDELLERVQRDPFVASDVVTAELFEVSPSRADPRLAFLLG
jgi:uncharacterized protein YciI